MNPMFETSAAGADGRAGGVLQFVGFGCVMAWTYVVFFSRLIHFSTRNSIEHLNSTYSFACCGMIAGYLACALLWRRLHAGGDAASAAGGPLASRRAPAAVAAVTLSACSLVLTLVERGLFMQPWCSITSTLAGCAVAVLSLGWAERFVAGDDDKTAARLVGSFVSGALLFVFTLYLPIPAGVVLTCLLPLVSLALLELLPPVGRKGPQVGHPVHEAFPAFRRALVSVCLLAFAEGMVRALFLEVDPAAQSEVYRWLFLASMIVACCVVSSTWVFGGGTGMVRRITRTAMLALAFLMLLSPIVYGLSLAADIPPLTCYCIMNLLVWIYFAKSAQAYRISTCTLFGLGLAVSYAGCLAGTFAGSVLTSFFELDHRMQGLLALVCACLVLVSFLCISDERTIAVVLDAEDERPQTPRRFRLRIEDVARSYGLTAKETEVFELAAKGRSTQRIREELGISVGTVNTHLAHIYKKLDVHDRQQMIDMLDARGADAS